MMEFHRAEAFHSKANLDMKRTALLFLLRRRDFSRELKTFTDSCRVFAERYHYGPSDRPEEYGLIAHWSGDQQELENLLTSDLNFVFCFVERRNEQVREYSILKIACRARNLPSQVISMEVLSKLKVNCLMSAIPAVIAKHEDSGVPWKMCASVFDDPFSSAMGIAHYLPSKQNESLKGVTEVSCGYGIYATRNIHGTTTVNDFGVFNRALKGGVMPELSTTLVHFFEKLKSAKGLGCMPQTLFVFRKGVPDSLISDVENYEVSAVRKAIEMHSGRVEWVKEARVVRILTYAVSGITSVKVKLAVATYRDVLDGDLNPKHLEEVMYVKGSEDARLSFDATVEAACLDEYGRAGVQIEVKLPANTTPEIIRNPVTLLLTDGSQVELPWRTRLVWLIVNLSSASGLRLYRNRNGKVVSPVSGSTVAMKRVEGRHEFYAVPCSPKDRIAKPTNYIVILNEPSVAHDDLQRLSLQLSSLYFNMKSSIKLPSVVRLAEEAAKQGFAVYGSSPPGDSENLAFTMANL
ncbi:MAG: uncharacterized protein KVP18_001787 [Porospora cf. gigantea A]|nr:MAG: hypothetical protein KVP18_001787 [Porospora cf. gigantea A]